MNGNKLKKMRENKGILQKEVANALNISASTIGMYEQNRREPDNNTLKKIANYFNVSTDYLLDNAPQKNEEEELEVLRNLLVKNKILNENEDLSKETLNSLIKFIKNNKEFFKK